MSEQDKVRERERKRARRADPAYRERENEQKKATYREKYATDPAFRAAENARQRERRQAPEVRAKEREAEARRRADPEYVRRRRAYNRAYRQTPAIRIREAGRSGGYVLSLEEYEALLTAQAGACAICAGPGPLHVDHCHRTGRVRGLLCPPCNKGIGHLRDDPNTLDKAAAYLRR